MWHPYLAAAILLVAVAVVAIRSHQERNSRTAYPGWVYFIGGDEGPIKVGMTQRHWADRLGELQANSPARLRVFYKEQMDDCRLAERVIHEELDEYRLHGEWFDRDAALALADYLRSNEIARA